MPKPTEKVIFYYTDPYGRKQSIKTIYAHAREIVIELLEMETVDIVRDVYYTIGNITHKLDYYNTEV